MTISENEKQADELSRLAQEKQDEDLHEDALALIEEAISLNPLDTVLWSVKGKSLYDLKRFTEAEATARTAIEKDQRNFHAWGLLGRTYAQIGYNEKAALCYQKSLRLHEDGSVYTLLAGVEYEFDLPSSIKHAQKALELIPGWEEAELVLKLAREALSARDK